MLEPLIMDWMTPCRCHRHHHHHQHHQHFCLTLLHVPQESIGDQYHVPEFETVVVFTELQPFERWLHNLHHGTMKSLVQTNVCMCAWPYELFMVCCELAVPVKPDHELVACSATFVGNGR